jgi:uncharacterized protein (DUF302 family)
LKNEGFGILSDINIHEKLEEKLDVSFRKYKILGACSPSHAYKALQKEDKIGTMLPYIIIQEWDNNDVEVAAIDPIVSMHFIENNALSAIADEIRSKLQRVIKSLNAETH